MKIRHRLEYMLVLTGMHTLPLLPRGGVVHLARVLGRAAYYFSAHLRKTGQSNLDIAFGNTKSPTEKRAILISSFQTFALVLLDLFWFSRNITERIRRYVRFPTEFSSLLKGRGALCITAHLGNWELLGKSTFLDGLILHSVAAPLKNTAVDQLFSELRTQTGQVIIPKKGAVRSLLRILNNNGVVALLLDQNTKPSDGGIYLPFFGLPVPVSTAPASLAIHTQADCLFGTCLPDAQGVYHIEAFRMEETADVLQSALPKQHKITALTELILKATEEQVRRNPEYWIWSYKRWKYVAPGYSRPDYPFYAKEMLDIDQRAATESVRRLAEEQG